MKPKLSWQCKRETIQKRVYCYFRGYLESCHPSIPVQRFTIFLMVREATQQGHSTSGWILSFWTLHSASILTVFQVMMLLFQFDRQTLGATPWPLQCICVMFSNFWTISDLTAVQILLEKSLDRELTVKVFVVPSMLPDWHASNY